MPKNYRQKSYKKVLSFERDAAFYYDMAENALAKNDLMTALRALFLTVKQDPRDIDAKIRLAEVYTMME